MLDNIRRKSSNTSIKFFYLSQYNFSKFKTTIYNKGVISKISTERCIKNNINLFKHSPISSDDIHVGGTEMKMLFCPGGILHKISSSQKKTSPEPDYVQRPFLLGETEITQELFQAVMGWNESSFKDSLQNPVENVNWYDCIDFCNKLSDLLSFEKCYEMMGVKTEGVHIIKAKVSCDNTKNGFRLPTEKEWEYAAKAGTNNQWSGTNIADDVYKYCWDSDNAWDSKTNPVGRLKPNEWGFCDMNGNVWEWCWDLFDTSDDKYKGMRALRGSSYHYNLSLCTIARRFAREEKDYGKEYGFRVCRTLV